MQMVINQIQNSFNDRLKQMKHDILSLMIESKLLFPEFLQHEMYRIKFIVKLLLLLERDVWLHWKLKGL